MNEFIIDGDYPRKLTVIPWDAKIVSVVKDNTDIIIVYETKKQNEIINLTARIVDYDKLMKSLEWEIKTYKELFEDKSSTHCKAHFENVLNVTKRYLVTIQNWMLKAL